MAGRNDEFFAQLDAEITLWPGVAWNYAEAHRGRHPRIILRHGDLSRFVTISGSPSDFRANHKRMSNVRQTLAQMGLTKRIRA